MGRSKLSFKIYKISKNFWNYYLVKWKIKKKAILILKTHPDLLSLKIDQDFFRYNKNLLKVIFKCIQNKVLEYYQDKNKIVVFSNDRNNKIECNVEELFYLETIRVLVEFNKNFYHYDNDLFLVEMDEGIKFLVRKNNVSDIGNLIDNFTGGQYSIVYLFLKGGIVLDVGSYIGDTPILFCKKGAKKVYAYEPHPLFYDICMKNICLNGLENNIEVYNYGIGDKDREMKISEDSLIGATSSFALEERKGAREIIIKIKSFSKILEELDRIDVLKMDCEGAEFPAILSCRSELLKKIKIMVIEYHRQPQLIIKYLTDIGFNVRIMKRYSERRGLIFVF